MRRTAVQMSLYREQAGPQVYIPSSNCHTDVSGHPYVLLTGYTRGTYCTFKGTTVVFHSALGGGDINLMYSRSSMNIWYSSYY